MIHKPILIKNLTLSLSHKLCFDNFNMQLNYGKRVAVIGRNGAGKTMLLKILAGIENPTHGSVLKSNDCVVAYVQQSAEQSFPLSVGQQFNASFTKALSVNPHVLLLDEPTNHLDLKNRKSLIRLLSSYSGTLIIASHDPEFMSQCVDTLWHIESGKINVFSGHYDVYLDEIRKQRLSLRKEASHFNHQKKRDASCLNERAKTCFC